MKKSGVFISTVFMFFLSATTMAQTQSGTGYFVGKWNMLVKGLPNGSTKMFGGPG